jgi:hypothetical protein
MNIGRYIRFLRNNKQLNWSKTQLLHHDSDQSSHGKIIEYQDRWTLPPSRARIWFNGAENFTSSHDTRSL